PRRCTSPCARRRTPRPTCARRAQSPRTRVWRLATSRTARTAPRWCGSRATTGGRAAGRRASRAAPGTWSCLRAELCEERVARDLDAQRRLVAVARMDDRLGRELLGEHPDGGQQGVPVRTGQVDAPDRPCEEQVAAEELAPGVESDVRRRVTRHGEALER